MNCIEPFFTNCICKCTENVKKKSIQLNMQKNKKSKKNRENASHDFV